MVDDPGWGQRNDHGIVNRPWHAGGAPALFTTCDGCEGTGQNGLVRRHWSKNRAYPHHGSGRKGVGPPPNTKQGHMPVGLRPEALGNRQLNSTQVGEGRMEEKNTGRERVRFLEVSNMATGLQRRTRGTIFF